MFRTRCHEPMVRGIRKMDGLENVQRSRLLARWGGFVDGAGCRFEEVGDEMEGQGREAQGLGGGINWVGAKEKDVGGGKAKMEKEGDEKAEKEGNEKTTVDEA